MSNEQTSAGAPWHLWVIGGLLLIWNGLAAFSYVAMLTRFDPVLSGYPEAVLNYYFNAPTWMMVMWGASTVGGFLGAALLLLRQKACVLVMVVAWLASVAAVFYTQKNPPPGGGDTIFAIAVLIAALFVIYYMTWLARKGFLR